MMSAPCTCDSAVFKFTTNPQSCTATILLTRTMPVSVSTLTSAICTPPTPALVRSGLLRVGCRQLTPCVVMPAGPSLAQACFHVRPLPPPLMRTCPFADSRCSGVVPSTGASFSNMALMASTEARRAAELTPPMVVEPPLPPDCG